MRLTVETERMSVCRLDTDAPWPAPPPDARIYSVTRTPNELSVVCAEGGEPPASRIEPGWRILHVTGPLAFDLVGVIASITAPLAESDVGVFVVSTYDTDLVLVKDADLDIAVGALVAAGHEVIGLADSPG